MLSGVGVRADFCHLGSYIGWRHKLLTLQEYYYLKITNRIGNECLEDFV